MAGLLALIAWRYPGPQSLLVWNRARPVWSAVFTAGALLLLDRIGRDFVGGVGRREGMDAVMSVLAFILTLHLRAAIVARRSPPDDTSAPLIAPGAQRR